MMAANTYHQFLRLVFGMRKAQKNYFKLRTQSALVASKRLEKEVDEWIKTCGFQDPHPEPQATQPELKP
jgi:hypothetical protein